MVCLRTVTEALCALACGVRMNAYSLDDVCTIIAHLEDFDEPLHQYVMCREMEP